MEDVGKLFERMDGRGVTLAIRLADLFCVIGNLELALRHPGNKGASSEVVRRIGGQMCAILIEEVPELGEEKELMESWKKSFDFKV